MNSLLDRYLKGESIISIAKHYGLSREMIYRELRGHPEWERLKEEYQKNKKHRNIQYYLNQSEKVFELAEDGLTSVHIGEKLNMPVRRIRQVLKGTKYDNSRASKKKTYEVIRSEYSNGKSVKKLVEKYGYCPSRIRKIIKPASLYLSKNQL